MWLIVRLFRDHKTIADFRRQNGPAICKPCVKFVELCPRIGGLKGEVVAVDGSKFKAVNGPELSFSQQCVGVRGGPVILQALRSDRLRLRVGIMLSTTDQNPPDNRWV